jgi:hypothetical protein
MFTDKHHLTRDARRRNSAISAPSPDRAMKLHDRRRSPRRTINRIAKIQFGAGGLPRDCLVTDISEGGVRLHIEGYEVPDEFVLLLSGEGIGSGERVYRVVWRLGFEVGARFVGLLRRPSMKKAG